MFKIKFIISLSIFVIFLLTTSAVKNKTRIIEKQILNLNKIILVQEKNINEAELDFYYLTSPIELEKKINLIGLNNYQPIKYSNIYLKTTDYNKIHNKILNLNNLNDKKIQKK
tara:strand:- start:54 stop:392 length:339 start_codon:yes stop_codon:yes gene_type:complete